MLKVSKQIGPVGGFLSLSLSPCDRLYWYKKRDSIGGALHIAALHSDGATLIPGLLEMKADIPIERPTGG